MTRWTLDDGTETWTMPINPDQASSPWQGKDLSAVGGVRQALTTPRVFQRAPQRPVEWTFGGVIRGQEHYETWLDWADRSGRIEVTDHLGRTFECYFDSFELEEQSATAKNAYRYRYTMRALVTGRVA